MSTLSPRSQQLHQHGISFFNDKLRENRDFRDKNEKKRMLETRLKETAVRDEMRET